jgi:hypothetical protein
MNLSGRWSGVAIIRNRPEGSVTMPVSILFQQDGDRISGTAESNDKRYEIRNGLVDGARLVFEIVSGDEHTYFELTAQEERIQGQATTKRANGLTRSGGLSLTRVTAA